MDDDKWLDASNQGSHVTIEICDISRPTFWSPSQLTFLPIEKIFLMTTIYGSKLNDELKSDFIEKKRRSFNVS